MDILKDVIVLDGFIPDIVIDEFYKFCTDTNNTDWYYAQGFSGVRDVELHSMFKDYNGFFRLGWHPLSNIILSYVLKEANLPSAPTVHRMRMCMTPKTNIKFDTISPMHIDLSGPHITIVYYANDNDGETVLFDRQVNDFNQIDHLTPPPILKRVKSKRGRAVVFNGKYQHSGSLSSDADRFFLNINISY